MRPNTQKNLSKTFASKYTVIVTQFWNSLLDISPCNYSHIYPSVPFVGLLSSIGSPYLSYKLNTHLLTFMMRKIHIIAVYSPKSSKTQFLMANEKKNYINYKSSSSVNPSFFSHISKTSKAIPQGSLNVPFWEYWTSPYSSHYRPYT